MTKAWAVAALVGWQFFEASAAMGLVVEVIGVGYRERVRARSARPAVGEVSQAAAADAAAKCRALFGHEVLVEPAAPGRFFEPEEERGWTLRTFEGRYHCRWTGSDRAALAERLAGIVATAPSRTPRFRGDLLRLGDYAIWGLAGLGEDAVPALARAASSACGAERREVLRALGMTRTGDWRVVELLLATCRDADEATRDEAAFALRSLGSSPALDAQRLMREVLPWLDAESVDDRRAAVEILSGLGRRGRAAKPALWLAVQRFPQEWLPPGPIDALISIGLDADDSGIVRRLAVDTTLHPVLRADVIRLVRHLPKEAGGVALLMELLSAEPGEGAAIFEDAPFLAALETLAKLGPSGDTAANRRIIERLAALERRLPSRYATEAAAARAVFEEPERREAELRAARERSEAERQAREKLEAAPDLKPILESLGSSDARTRAIAFEAVSNLGEKARGAKEALFAVYVAYPTQPEPGLSRLDGALLRVGIDAADLPRITAAWRTANLHPLRRGSLARLLATLGPKARPALPLLREALELDLTRLKTEESGLWSNPVDGETVEVVKAVAAIGPSGDARLDGAIEARLKTLVDTDHFNVPVWLRRDAQAALDGWRVVRGAAER